MRLSALTRGLTVRGGSGDPDITVVTEDSRRVRPGGLFVAIKGTTLDGHDYVPQALDRGAAAIVLERADALPPSPVAHAVVPNSREALAVLADRFYDSPARQLSLIGFTGTFGKTTTSDILRALLDAGGMKPAVIGSLGVRFDRFSDPGDGLTTPAPPQLQAWLSEVLARGARSVVLEVTSHALRLGRVKGLHFEGGLLAGIMPGEHTDFHRSYEDYLSAKRLFLEYLRPDAILAYDADNRAARELATEASVRARVGFTIGGASQEALQVQDVTLDHGGAVFRVNGQRIRSSLLGRPNVRNTALALAYALGSGMSVEEASPVLASLQPLARRVQRSTVAGRAVLDDTAGHPDSLIALFEVVELFRRDRLWIVWAVRGSRGVDINRANALCLADLAAWHGAAGIFVTASEDATGPADRVRPEEVDAVRAALYLRARPYTFIPCLEDAMSAVAAQSRAGDLVVLAGAQGMNEGKRLLDEALGSG